MPKVDDSSWWIDSEFDNDLVSWLESLREMISIDDLWDSFVEEVVDGGFHELDFIGFYEFEMILFGKVYYFSFFQLRNILKICFF